MSCASAIADCPVDLGVVNVVLVDAAREVGLQGEVLRLIGGLGVTPVVDVVDRLHSDLDELFAAAETGAHGGVTDGVFDAYAELGGHEYRVLFRVDADAQIKTAS